MKPTKINYVKHDKFRKFVNPKISYIFDRTLVFSINCKSCGNANDRMFKKEESFGRLKAFSLI